MEISTRAPLQPSHIHCANKMQQIAMSVGARTVPCWLLFLTISLLVPSNHARQQQHVVIVDGSKAGTFRRLLVRPKGNITVQEAEDTLRDYGVDDFGTIVYMSTTPTCPVAGLPASASGQLFTYCKANGDKRACQAEGTGGTKVPLFRLTCENHTCIETLTNSETACTLNRAFDVPLASAASADCELNATLAPMSNGSTPFTPEFLQPVGSAKSLLECILGVPEGTRILNELLCDNGFFRLATIVPLGGEAFVPQGVPFRCIWDGRCREHDGCCQGDAVFEGTFICYLVQRGSKGQADSSTVQRACWELLLAAVLLASVLAL
eukprot:evm.model.scf_901.7 EVM.evm.TU.scf_901.7   scf_901:52480-54232(-)